MKSLKKSILLYLGLVKDFTNYIYLYERLSFYSKSSIREAVNDLEAKGFVEKLWQGRQAYFRLTNLGKEALERLWPALFAKARPWHKYFYLVILKACRRPQRQWLIKQLHLVGFKQISRGTYLNFYPITEEVRKKMVEKALLDRLIMVKVKDFCWLSPDEVIFQAWEGKKIQTITKEIISEIDGLLKELNQQKGLSKEAKKSFSRLNKKLILTLKRWPVLPKGLGGLDSGLNRLFNRFAKLNHRWQSLS